MSWAVSGFEVGNHTADHVSIDVCSRLIGYDFL